MPNYSVDTSAILDAWVRHYPIDTFPSFWSNFENFIKSEIGIASELIKHELSVKDDGCIKWFKQNDHEDFFRPINDEVQNNVSILMQNPNYQRLVEDRKGTGLAPY